MRGKLLFVVGTRPEAIKMAPVYRMAEEHFDCRLCATSQHQEILKQALDTFSLKPDYDLCVMKENQSLFDVTCGVLNGLRDVIAQVRPLMVLVQGDTTSTMAGALAAFYSGIPIGHVEAGLRTGNSHEPWPEETNRRLISCLATWHYAATEGSRTNLIREGIPESRILITGNPVIDSMDSLLNDPNNDMARAGGKWSWISDDGCPTVLVTIHRRENLGPRLKQVLEALVSLSDRHPEVRFVFPVHPNPGVRAAVGGYRGKRGTENSKGGAWFVEPLPYPEFLYLLSQCSFVMTDSGGVQEEAPSFGKPVLVLRNTTERREGLSAGVARLIGTEKSEIIREVTTLLRSQLRTSLLSGGRNPYGDGEASRRIVNHLKSLFEEEVPEKAVIRPPFAKTSETRRVPPAPIPFP